MTTASEFYRGIAAEFSQHYKRGPRFIAVTGVPESDTSTAADELAASLAESGDAVERASLDREVGAAEFRESTVAPFREARADAVLVVDGPQLLTPDFRGFWNFSLWIEHDPERSPDWSFVSTGRKDPLGAPREVASVLLDDADAAHPRRLFADSC